MADVGDRDVNPSDTVEVDDDDPMNGESVVEDEDEDEEDDEIDQEVSMSNDAQRLEERRKLEGLLWRLKTENVPLRVHEVVIKGNMKTKESVIESEIKALKNANSLQEVFQIASVVNSRLREMDIFDEVDITIDVGPKELPGTANVVVEVVETRSPVAGSVGMYTKPGVCVFAVIEEFSSFLWFFVVSFFKIYMLQFVDEFV